MDYYLEVALDLQAQEDAERMFLETFGATVSYRSIDRIDSQIAALEQQKIRLLSQPDDKFEEGDVVWFTKGFGPSGPHRYTYAALKHGGRWYVTQSGTQQRPMSWDALLEFVGDGEMWAATEWEVIQ
jgi:hypothetical protein